MAKCIDCGALCGSAGKDKEMWCDGWEAKVVEKSCKNCILACPCTNYEECIKNNYSLWMEIEEQVSNDGETGTIEPITLCAEETSGMTRQQLTEQIYKYCDGIKELFTYKNSDYGQDIDAFANFRKTAQRVVIPFMQKHGVQVDEHEAMFVVLMVYADKHLVALSQTGLGGNEVAERMGDVANYMLIAKGILADKEAAKND